MNPRVAAPAKRGRKKRREQRVSVFTRLDPLFVSWWTNSNFDSGDWAWKQTYSDIHTQQETDWSHVWRKLMQLDWKNKASNEKKKAPKLRGVLRLFLLPSVASMLSSHVLFKYLIHCLCVLMFGEKGHPRIYISCRQRWFPVTFPRPRGCAVDRTHKTPRIPTKHITTLRSPRRRQSSPAGRRSNHLAFVSCPLPTLTVNLRGSRNALAASPSSLFEHFSCICS